MAAGFDPYHHWLSIPPAEQPPNHYRLLGLQAFESSVGVIENAASRQLMHVRRHLQTPLRPYALMLIRELEVARICLTDGEAKRVYDGLLRQREAYLAREVLPTYVAETKIALSSTTAKNALSERTNIDVAAFDLEAGGQHANLDIFVPPVVTATRSRRRKSKSGPITYLFLWLTSAVIGLLAGYAVLCIIDPKYDFLRIMHRDEAEDAIARDRADPPAAVARSSDRRHSLKSTGADEVRAKRIAPPQFDARNSTAKLEEKETTTQRDAFEVTKKWVDTAPVPENIRAQPVGELKPIEFPFDLKKRIIRVVSSRQNLPADKLRCNMHCSTELNTSPLIDLPLGEKRDLVFNIGINDAIVGAEISFLPRNQLLVVEIRPKYRLPSGDEEALYKTAGLRKAQLLVGQVSAATNARSSLPDLRNRLSRVTSEYQAVLPTANTPTTGNGYLRQTAAQLRAAALFDQGAELERQIRGTQSHAERLPSLESDLAAVRQLGEWGAAIAQTATLAVCIHHEGVSLPMEIK